MTYLIQWLMATNPNGLSLGPGGLTVEAQLTSVKILPVASGISSV